MKKRDALVATALAAGALSLTLGGATASFADTGSVTQSECFAGGGSIIYSQSAVGGIGQCVDGRYNGLTIDDQPGGGWGGDGFTQEQLEHGAWG
ncbi:hypothetical protein ACFYNF_33330 [Streptomyces sp. NPDC006641]|uniref:hypothetical protein n=1 Tax=unclassified Streptomyces TaxID=2593676 RepID=UPI00368DE40A